MNYNGTNGSIEISKDGTVTVTVKGPPKRTRKFRAKKRWPKEDHNDEPTGSSILIFGDGDCTLTIFVRDDCKVVVTIKCPNKKDDEYIIEGIPQERKNEIIDGIIKLLPLGGGYSYPLGIIFKAKLSAPGEIEAFISLDTTSDKFSIVQQTQEHQKGKSIAKK